MIQVLIYSRHHGGQLPWHHSLAYIYTTGTDRTTSLPSSLERQLDPLTGTLYMPGQPKNYEMVALSILHSRPHPKAWHCSAILC
jgi:hypothetical protein